MKLKTSLLTILWLGASVQANFTLAASNDHSSPLFDSRGESNQDSLMIEIAGPIRALLKESTSDRVQRPFQLTANGVKHKVKISVRGKSRSKLCKFPPLRLNFSKKNTAGTIFDNQDKLKLVTKCAASKRNDAESLMEFAAYKIFNLISSYSYQVRALTIKFSDPEKRLSPNLEIQQGFLIESNKELAKRLNLKRKNKKGVSLARLDKQHMADVYLFQYLIGNTDWSLVSPDDSETCCHNGTILSSQSSDYYLPYDFDLSGLVNTKYAKPDPSVGIRRVTKRKYRGFCTDDEYLRTSIEKIKTLEAKIYQVLNELQNVDDDALKPRLKFIDRYFQESKDPQKFLASLRKQCLD